MSEQKQERWRELCELAAVEQDPKKLLELVKEVIRESGSKGTATECEYRFDDSNRWPTRPALTRSTVRAKLTRMFVPNGGPDVFPSNYYSDEGKQRSCADSS